MTFFLGILVGFLFFVFTILLCGAQEIEKGKEMAALLFYLTGSLCFAIGSIISIVRLIQS